MNKIESATIGIIGRSKKKKNPVFRIPGVSANLYWQGESPPIGTEMSVAEFLIWIDEHQLTLYNRHLIDPVAAEAKRVRDSDKSALGYYWQHELALRAIPTEKQLAFLAKLKYVGTPPTSKAEARDLIGAVLKRTNQQ